MSLTFRPALPSDVAAVVALVELAYRGPASRGGWTTEADLLDGQRTDADEVSDAVAGRGVLLAEADGTLVGCCHLQVRPDRVAAFGMFAVDPGAQGSGTGSALLAEAERRARAAGARQVEMTVIAQRTELIAFYRRRGYLPTGQQRPFPYGDTRFGVPRRADLVFTVLVRALG